MIERKLPAMQSSCQLDSFLTECAQHKEGKSHVTLLYVHSIANLLLTPHSFRRPE